MRNLFKDRRGLSPVVATVILISVTIVVAISVAYWMATISSSYTTFEQIEIPVAYPEYHEKLYDDASGPGWNVTVQLKNTGSADAVINNIYLNDKPVYVSNYKINITEVGSDGTKVVVEFQNDDVISVPKGESKEIIISILADTEGCGHGVRVDFKFHSASGKDYPLLIKLP